MSDELIALMADIKEDAAIDLAEKLLNEGQDPLKVLGNCREAVEIVGKRFESGQYFLPELILAGEMLKKVSSMAEPFVKKDALYTAEKRGKVLMGTVKGDIHDLGKDIVIFLLDINGFEVHDLGVDVPPETFVEAIIKFQPQVVGMSALLTLAFESMKSTVKAIKEAGLRDSVKIMIGGSTVDETVRRSTGADAYGPDAMAAVRIAGQWVKSLRKDNLN